MNTETLIQVVAIIAPCALTITGAILSGFHSIDKRLDDISKQLQDYVKKDDCKTGMSDHCDQLKALREKVQENSEDIAFLKSKH